MPQLNVADFLPQLFWLAITFVALYVVLSRVALPRIGEVIDERNARINGDLAAAQKLKAETEAAIAAYEKALADARARGSSIASAARDELAKQMAADRAALDRDIAAKNAEAEARISALKAQSGEQITVIARDAASAVIDRFLGAGFDKADIDSAVSERVGR